MRLWHGEADQEWPVETGRYLAQAVPQCEATFVPGEGHLLYLAHWEPILRELITA